MENKSHAIVAVSFLIIFFVGAILAYYWLSHQAPEPRLYKIVTTQSVGLKPKSPVTFKGLLVGHVQQVHFDPQDPAKVDVLFTVQKDALVTKSTYAVAQRQGITGGQALALKLGEGSREKLPTSHDDPALIPLRKSFLTKLMATVQSNMQKISEIVTSVQKILSKTNRAHLADTLQQIDKASRKLVAIESHLLPLAKKMPEIADTLQQTLEQSHALLTQATQLSRKAQKVIETTGRVAKSLQQSTLPSIDKLTESLLQTSKSINELAEKLTAQPQSLIFGGSQPQPGPGEPGFGKNGNGE